jgi:ATP sulfurylase
MKSKKPETASTRSPDQEKAGFSTALQVENTLKALKRARRRRKELRSLLEILQKEYRLVKIEIGLYEDRIERWMSDKEYSAYLDTIRLDASPEFSIPSDQKSTDKK